MARDRVNEFIGLVARLVSFVVASFGLLLLVGVVLKPALPGGLPFGDAGRVIFTFMVALSLLAGHGVVIIGMEKTRWDLAGLGEGAWSPRRLLGALSVGAGVAAIPALVLLLSGPLQLVAGSDASWGSLAFLTLLSAAVFAAAEELAFRGYVLGLLAHRWGQVAAVSVTSVFYALYYLVGVQATPAALVSVVLFGALLGTLRLRTMSLPAVWLAHLGFNWTQVAVLHAPAVWLHPVDAPRYRAATNGADWLSGGTVGVETGLATGLTPLVVLALVVRFWPRPQHSDREAYRRAQSRM
jgi:membrane protease YdiL (CAAX protease family)